MEAEQTAVPSLLAHQDLLAMKLHHQQQQQQQQQQRYTQG
jgi:hypothetical protein